jgi:hypothetical protein
MNESTISRNLSTRRRRRRPRNLQPKRFGQCIICLFRSRPTECSHGPSILPPDSFDDGTHAGRSLAAAGAIYADVIADTGRFYPSGVRTRRRYFKRRLEELHRLRVLVPFFQIDLEPPAAYPKTAVAAPKDPPSYSSTVLTQLADAADEQRLADPAAVAYERWPTEPRRTLWPGVATGYLYSPHQLLQLQLAEPLIKGLLPSRDDDGNIWWSLPDDKLPDEETLVALESWRSFAVILSALDTPFWPEIRHQVTGDFDQWRKARVSFDPQRTLGWLGVSEDSLCDQAERLLAWGAGRDVLGDFYDVVRRVSPAKWKSLRGAARVAMDWRISAELLWRLLDQLGVDGPPQDRVPVSQQRLSGRTKSLDALLTGLGVSPFPALVLALEGATEMYLMPRVLELLGIRQDGTWIETVDFGGTKRDLSLLARYASQPKLGGDAGECVMLDRPVTRFLVLTDAENLYKDELSRERQRRNLLESMTQDIPRDLRSDLVDRENSFVEIQTWGSLPFEFAHFSDTELAQALTAASKWPLEAEIAELEAAIAAQRTVAAPNIEHAWPRLGVRKRKLAEALWPLLKTKIDEALNSGEDGPPILRAALRTDTLARMDYGKSIILRRMTQK